MVSIFDLNITLDGGMLKLFANMYDYQKQFSFLSIQCIG